MIKRDGLKWYGEFLSCIRGNSAGWMMEIENRGEDNGR